MNENSITETEEFIQAVQKTYPGIRRFIDIGRYFESGETHILVYDLDKGILPIYSISIHPRDILICGKGMVIPFLTFEEYHNHQWPEGIPEAKYGL